MTDYADWIGRTTERSEVLTPALVDRLRVTLAEFLAETLTETPDPEDVPLGAHWCLAPEAVAPDQLGQDGHPRTGLFLPALPLPRRMWAGGALRFVSPLRPGDMVTRRSFIEAVTLKPGRSGPLGFVQVRHDMLVDGQLRLSERHDIVYREAPAPGVTPAAPPGAEAWPDATVCAVQPTPTLLFRFSALTFNGHRIHYDHPYATGVEGYDGLVVHGPLQAVWMMTLARGMLSQTPATFAYRGLAPLICDQPAVVEGRPTPEGLALRVRRLSDNVVTMSATASL